MSLQSLEVNVIVERVIARIEDNAVEPTCLKCDDTGTVTNHAVVYTASRCTCSAGRTHA